MFQPPWLTRRTRWAVPTGAVAAVAVVAAGAVFTSAASTTPSLPHRTPEQLIAQIAAPRTGPQTLIGTIQTSAALGLPTKKLSDPKYVGLQSSPNGLAIEVQKVEHPSRVHLDIEADDVEAEAARLEKLGAKRIEKIQTWWVMEAPTGHHFCVIRAKRAEFAREANVWK